MKTTDSTLRAHLDQEVTALCTCWVIKRVDGTVLRFTDADIDVVQDGEVYKSIGAYQRTAIENTATLSVDNLEIIGAANDLALPEEELRAGLFDNAEITVFITSWLDSVPGRLRVRRGFFGEVQVLPNGTYKVELRGLMQRLNYTYTKIFSPVCLYDLGSPGCGINIKGKDVDAGLDFAVGDHARIAQSTHKRGKFYGLAVNDPDFEEAGAGGGFAKSPYWSNLGPSDLILDTGQKYSGSYSARGGSGAGGIFQDVDLEADTGLPEADIDSEKCYLTFRAFRMDSNDEGKLTLAFLGPDGTELGYGQQLNVGGNSYSLASVHNMSGDFTVELWLKNDVTPSIDQAIFTQGAFGGAGTTGCRFTYEGGRLTLRIDDDVLPSNQEIVVQSSVDPAPAGTWQHVALVRSGSALFLYEDFALTGTGTYTGTISIEQWGGGPNSSGFIGAFDELRVWNVAKTVTDLALAAKKTIAPATPGLQLYYSFDDANGADLTGNDTLQFGSANLIIGAGSPVATDAASAAARGTATYTTGFQNVGTAWTEIGVQDHLIPANARRLRITFEVNPVGTAPVESWIDNITGHVINTNESGPVIGYMTDDVAWTCTQAGTTTADTVSGGVGSSVSIGATFLGEDAWLRGGRVLAVIDNRTFICEINDPRAVDEWFTEGTAIFETGANAGVAMEIKSWDAAQRRMELFLSLPNQIKAGDYFSAHPGCDKSRISCAAIFNNARNMFATPDVPGQDELYRYPDAK